MIEPREKRSDQSIHIMWTLTREQTNPSCFFPNHFVTLMHTKREETEVTCPLDDYSGSYVVVNYDGQVYPDKVLTDDEVDIEVNVSSVGDNRFFWPDSDDICWYDKKPIVAVIPPPTATTARYMKVDIHPWAALCEMVNSHN